MPVQINEVVIRVIVGDNPAAPNHSGSMEGQTPSISEAHLAERILEIIKEKNER